MEEKTALVYSPEIKNYSFGQNHPFASDRFEIFLNFFEKRFAKFKDRFVKIKPKPANDEVLKLVHDKEYIETLKKASEGKILPNIHQYVSGDNLNPSTGYIPKGIEEGAKICVGTSLLAGELVVKEEYKKAIGIGGGLHHAKSSYGEGFCFYNDIAVLAKSLKQKYDLKKILILDTDAHAGNGVEEIFYDDSEVLFIDFHQYSFGFYPGTGKIEEIGAGKGKGLTVNLPLAPGTGYDAYRYLFEKIVFPLVKEFQPKIMIRYGGSDPHYLDGLTDLGLSLDGFLMIGREVRELAKEVCQEKEVDLLASGYNQRVLPYAWSALIAGLLDLDIDLGDLKERTPPARNVRYKEAKDVARELKKYLKKYWRCMK